MAIRSPNVKSLLLTLKQPVRICLAPQDIPDSPLTVDGLATTRPSFPPWPACADILFNYQARIFVGLSYPVDVEDESLVLRLCSSLPNEVIRYNNFTLESLRKPYEANDDFDINRLEIIWTDIGADHFETAQLDSGFWYYSKKQLEENQVIAFGLTNIDEILYEYNLVLPNRFPFPQFIPAFIW